MGARVRSGRWAVTLAVLVLSALVLAAGALGATAEECTPLKKRACKKSPYCKWGGKSVRCAVALNACDAVPVLLSKEEGEVWHLCRELGRGASPHTDCTCTCLPLGVELGERCFPAEG